MQTIHGLDGLSAYFDGVERRLRHHGKGWRALVGTLTTSFLPKIDPNADHVVRTHNCNLANQIRLFLRNGRCLKVTYSPSRGVIVVHDGRTELARFTPDHDLDDVGKTVAAW